MEMRRLLACLVGLALAVVTVNVAFAHAEPSKVTPGDGAVLAEAPTQVVIEMSQEMARQADANDIDVLDASGKEVTTVAATIDDGDRSKLSVPLQTNLPTGVYTIKWKTLSADDGDPANGELTFTIDPAKPASAGKETLRETGIGGEASPTSAAPTTAAATSPAAPADTGTDGGTSWVLVAAVAVGMLAVGSGGTFLFIKKGS